MPSDLPERKTRYPPPPGGGGGGGRRNFERMIDCHAVPGPAAALGVPRPQERKVPPTGTSGPPNQITATRLDPIVTLWENNHCITTHYNCITAHYKTLHALQRITVHYKASQYITRHHSALQCITVHYNAVVNHKAVHYHKALQRITAPESGRR